MARDEDLSTGRQRETVNAIWSSERVPPILRPSLPPDLDSIIGKALEKDRDLRYQSAADFRADIRRLLRTIDSATGKRRGGTITKPVSLTASRARRMIAVAAVLATAVVLMAVWRFSQSQTAPPDWTRATNVQLTDQRGTEYFPTLAPDGKSFVYASRVNGTGTCSCKASDGKNATRSHRTSLE